MKSLDAQLLESGDDPVVNLGRCDYAETHELMLALHESIRSGATDGKVLLVEHDPVFTAGRATPPEDITASGAIRIERGGKITFHGPGQLVIYPIVRLPERDVRDWLERLETFGVELCGKFGLDAQPSVDGTGVFVRRNKVGSIGVAIRHWINLHGLSLNIAMDLEPFYRVRPCGLDPEIMSDLSREASRPISMDEAVEHAHSLAEPLLRSETRD